MPILQVNFKLNVPVRDYTHMCQAVAHAVADVPGLQWKLWLLNEKENEAGGIYSFSSHEAIDAYLAGPIITPLKTHPALRDLTVKRFELLEEMTAVTRGPVSAAAAAT